MATETMSQQEESSVMGSGTPRSTASLLSTLFLSLCYHLSSVLSQSGMPAIFHRQPLTPLRRTGSARWVPRGLDSPHSIVSLYHIISLLYSLQTDINKLKDAGIHSLQDILYRPRHDLAQINGLSEAKVVKLYDSAKKHLPSHHLCIGG